MNSVAQVKLLRAVGDCLRPLARLMLRFGIGYRQFAELAKIAFVKEASGEPNSRGRVINISRVAIRTGLSRKEVARLRTTIEPQGDGQSTSESNVYNSGHAARALQIWHSDRAFLTAEGAPRRLTFSRGDSDFGALVRAVGGDVPPGAVKAELLEAGAVVEDEDGSLRPIKRYFIPADVGEDLLVGFSHFVTPVLEGLDRNTGERRSQPFIQRIAYSDRLVPSAVPLFRKVARDRASDFIQSVDDWLVSNEIQSSETPTDALRVGIGVFYYEGDPPNTSATDSTSNQDRK
jgi:hypothetical protein